MKDIWITTIGGKSALVHADLIYDGGMVEFYDAVTGVFRGCAGINWWNEHTHRVLYEGELPAVPEKGRWIV